MFQIFHPDICSLVGHLETHPLPCPGWWDWVLSRWPAEASSFAFICVSTSINVVFLILVWMCYSWSITFLWLSSYQRSTTAISVGTLMSTLSQFAHFLKNIMQCLINVVFPCSVAPICYAHLAAAQMGQFMKFEDFAETSSGSGVHSSTSTAVPDLPRLHSQVCSSMFFCWGGWSTLCAIGLTVSVEKSDIKSLATRAGWHFVSKKPHRFFVTASSVDILLPL